MKLFLCVCSGFISVQSFSVDFSSVPSPAATVEQSTNRRLIQDIALKAFETALKERSKRFLHISPNGTGKTFVLAQALKSRIIKWEEENRITTTTSFTQSKTAGKISIVTAHQIPLVDQLVLSISQELNTASVNLINWNNVKKNSGHKNFEFYVREALKSPDPTVFMITTQSLKPALDHLFQQYMSSASPASSGSSLYERLAKNLDGIYIDEAHHLGAYHTKRAFLMLLEFSRAFLYGATATPFHYKVNITEIFGKKQHWSYLNHIDNLFQTHSVEDILDQLSLAIGNKDIIPFEDLYIIGESSFKKIKNEPVFIKGTSEFFVLNPAHYKRLAEILYSVLLANKKGFIIVATIEEAERIQKFLSGNRTFKEIQFEVYHSGLEESDRRRVLQNSRKAVGSHYIVAVRALDEGVDLPHLSAYVDLNFTVSIRQMIQRIGRVLRLYPGKQMVDILFLVDYKNAGMVRDILNILEKIDRLSFKIENEGKWHSRSGDSHFSFLGSDLVLLREDLLRLREELTSSVRKFWSEKKPRLLTWEELREAIREYNDKASEEKKISSFATYKKIYKQIPGAPFNLRKVYPNFKEKGGWRALWGAPPRLTWKELKKAIREYNRKAPAGKKITSKNTYKKFYTEIPGASFSIENLYPDFKEGGGWYALLGKPIKPPFLTWEELKRAIREYNEQAPEGKKITSRITYTEFYKQVPGASSNPAEVYPGFKEGGGWYALLDKPIKPPFLTWEELKRAIREYNEQASAGKKITSKITYKEFYKQIPGASSHPGRMYPGFTEKGGWYALLGKTCSKVFTI